MSSTRSGSPMSSNDDSAVVVEMGGTNVVVRAPAGADHTYSESLAELINAATRLSTIVVLDPAPLRCDDAFARHVSSDAERSCVEHATCRPSQAKVVADGMVHIRTEAGVWLIDPRLGRLARTCENDDPQFVAAGAWAPIVAVRIAPARITSLGPDGNLTSARRDHLPAAA